MDTVCCLIPLSQKLPAHMYTSVLSWEYFLLSSCVPMLFLPIAFSPHVELRNNTGLSCIFPFLVHLWALSVIEFGALKR